MKTLLLIAAFALQAGAQPPDISGHWIRSLGEGSAPDSRWSDRIEISQTDQNLSLTIQQGPGKVEKYRLNGLESAEVLTVNACANTTRITKAESRNDTITITTRIVTKIYCAHGEDPDDPFINQTGFIAVSKVKGASNLESKVVLYRDRNGLVVETTRPSFGDIPMTTTTWYRK